MLIKTRIKVSSKTDRVLIYPAYDKIGQTKGRIYAYS